VRFVYVEAAKQATILGVVRAVISVLFLLILAAGPWKSEAKAKEGDFVISGGDLPHGVRLAAADEDAFLRRINTPPKLDKEPQTSGASYVVTSGYWDEVLRGSREDRAAAAAEASYFPNGGFVRARQGGRDVWLALDVRQQTILARYIRLTREAQLSETPGSFEVIRAAAKTETVGVTVGSRELTDDDAKRFWDASKDVSLRPDLKGAPRPLSKLTGDGSVTWIVVTMPEGRSVDFVYSLTSSVLEDRNGAEVYSGRPRWLESILGAGFGDASLAPAQVAQQPGRGSPVWWVLMVGGGVVAMGLAFVLRAKLVRHGN